MDEQKTRNVRHLGVLLVLCGVLAGCSEPSKPATGRVRPLLVSREQMNSTSYRLEIIRSRYPHLVNRVRIEPVTPPHHAKELLAAQSVEDAAYHVIAIGVLGQDTSEVRAALDLAEDRYGTYWIPARYDWPDKTAAFEERLKELAESDESLVHSDMSAHYPGNRSALLIQLIAECRSRIQ